MERDKSIPEAATAYEAAPAYTAIPLETRSVHPLYPVDLESNNGRVEPDNSLTANRAWLVRVFTVRTDTLDEAERQMRAAGLMFALLVTLGIAIMVGTLIALYIQST
ncbi:hypothetical protein QBC36DRAFT_295077 [Triangularia setosa]|uniref:Uncharacterized protein n=1 Tax=Triangularia setosa TaxID=2587417 RepID=A0AAN6VXX3_9PEZI|nr:hypothetical protein QBC36DRAFT_295077 [Podospora setosa]